MRAGRRIRACAVLAAALAAATPALTQPVQRDARDEREERERDIRLSQQSPRALINNIVIQRERSRSAGCASIRASPGG